MNPATKNWIWFITVAIVFLLAGIVLGGMLTAHKNQAVFDEQQRELARAPQQQAQEVETLANLAMWQARANTCEANFQTETILYEPGAPPALTLLHGLINVQPGPAAGASGPVGPRWIVPARIKPQAVPGSTGFIFAYFDPASRKLDGPYLPKIAATDQ